MKLKTIENQYRAKLLERQKQIRVMRAHGLTWRAIGLALGISKQRAEQLGKHTTAKLYKAKYDAE